MSTSRRNFIKTSAMTVAGTAFFSKVLLASNKKPTSSLGIQLYSVRADMMNNPVGTLKQLAAIGYSNVEHANYENRKFYGYSANEFKKIIDGFGLKMPSGHTVMGTNHWSSSKNDFTDDWKYTIEDAATVGQQYVISPWIDDSFRKNIDDLKRCMDIFNKSGVLCQNAGMKFGYHNHNFEFSTTLDGVKLYDIILENTNPYLVTQQIDIGNMYGAGGMALEYIKQYPGRFELIHVKDEIKAEKGEMDEPFESTILGTGLVPVKEIIELAQLSGGTKHFIVEQESYQGKMPIDCAKADYDIMKQWGF